MGDLTPDVDDGMLYEFFVKVYPSCRGGKVVLLCIPTRWGEYQRDPREGGGS